MSNEQCGMCWDLKLDKNGKQTHELKHHDFIPLDYCKKCGKHQYDQYGNLTHPYVVHDFSEIETFGLPHEFVSSIQEKNSSQWKKHRMVVTFIGISGFLSLISFTNPFFVFP